MKSEETVIRADVVSLAAEWAGLDASGLITAALGRFGRERLVLATSFSMEDQVLADMLLTAEPQARIFTLDTGRLFQETYDVWQATQERYGVRIESYAPQSDDLAGLVAQEGPNLFYAGIVQRKKCCEVRKVRPLRTVLATADAWICGLRRGQSVTRDTVVPVDFDGANGVIRICPLADWTEEQVRRHIKERSIPYNRLFDHGFRSVGCAPCTRATGPGEDPRAGRWWWEHPGQKECGLHARRSSTPV